MSSTHPERISSDQRAGPDGSRAASENSTVSPTAQLTTTGTNRDRPPTAARANRRPDRRDGRCGFHLRCWPADEVAPPETRARTCPPWPWTARPTARRPGRRAGRGGRGPPSRSCPGTHARPMRTGPMRSHPPCSSYDATIVSSARNAPSSILVIEGIRSTVDASTSRPTCAPSSRSHVGVERLEYSGKRIVRAESSRRSVVQACQPMRLRTG